MNKSSREREEDEISAMVANLTTKDRKIMSFTNFSENFGEYMVPFNDFGKRYHSPDLNGEAFYYQVMKIFLMGRHFFTGRHCIIGR